MNDPLATKPFRPFLLWVVLSLVVVAVLTAFDYRAAVNDMSREAAQAETRLTEKLAQHDAHLTALAAVLRMARDEPSAGEQGLAEAVMTYYPRITRIETLRVQDQQVAVVKYGQAIGPVMSAESAAGLPALAKPGDTSLRALPGDDMYELYKLVSQGLYLRLRVDAEALINDGSMPSNYDAQLWLGKETLTRARDTEPTWITVRRSVAVNSNSQPLRLEMARSLGVHELLPLAWMAPLLLAVALAVWLVAQYRDAMEARRQQELRATLLEQEARLAHAGRVNALGEMASGIAHELAQPVAALLTQSQAARRAAAQSQHDILQQALDANVREAKRAGDILGRMRTYIAGGAATLELVPLDQAVNDALRLVEPELARRGIALQTQLSSTPCEVRIDAVAFQQIVFNLVLNAAEALAGRTGARIVLTAGPRDAQAVVTVADNGPGIPTDTLPRVFEPFFTTKPEGMGLGLPLCARLAEKMEGTLEAANDGGAVFTLRLPMVPA